MDFLKILSRSTKQQANKGRTGKDVKAALPSAGLSANPQLYHDVVPESRGKKRKRGGERTVEEKQESEDEDIDFFATPFTASRAKKIAPAPDPTTKAATKEPLPAAEPLDEEECRQILRSHRLKVTLLPCTQVPVKKKKSKKSKPSKPAKGESKQLFPQPLQTFGELRTIYGLSRRMADNLAEQGYKIATEVQMASLPMLLRPDIAFRNSASELRENPNIDLLAVAPTGSGKTLAFLIPIVDQIIQRRRTQEDKAAHSLEAIVIAPTKELAHQIVNEAKKLSLGTGVKVAGMKKGMSIVAGETQEGPDPGKENEDGYSSEDEDQEKTSKKKGVQPVAKADILVATPGLLLSALLTSSPEAHSPLPTVRTLVLDEADVLLDPLFREQTLAIWNSCTSPNLRVRLWSATMGSNIESLAASAIQTRLVSLSPPSTSNLIRLVVGLKDSAIPNIKHDLIYTGDEKGKLLEFRELLRPSSSKSTTLRPPFIVFTQTIPRAIELHHELRYDIPTTAGGSTRIAVLHSDLSDTVRSNIMARFRNGEIWILITTDILSRGVDFKGVNGVVNFDIPQSGASYIHRVGRTGRAGRNGGIAITYYTKEDIPFVKPIGNIIAASEKQAGLKPSEVGMKKWLLDSLPTPSKEEKKKLKMHGVEGRRGGLKKEDGKMIKGKGRISTQSGYERKLENNRKGAIEGSKRRAKVERENPTQDEVAEDSEWGGIDG